MLRSVLAPNASALTLDGTRTYVVGSERVVVIDPGSSDSDHLDAVAELVGDGVVVSVLVTHAHPDHESGANALAERFRCTVRMQRRGTLQENDQFSTDTGELVAVATPGHTRDHVAFHWPDGEAVFCGDLMMGGHDTALVAPPDGRLGPYLASLDRLRELSPRVIYPAHGPAFEKPEDALERYVRHRQLRLQQVERALAKGAQESEALLEAVYGEKLEAELRAPATAALKAYLEHLQGLGRIRRIGRSWEAAAS